ncbi:MAG TPA: hypothetical protein VMQ52_00990 [Candidatus Saccharimonadales bacterium]|nr:hypothetical protein [Candidatus Saccharimonadales bacterium]
MADDLGNLIQRVAVLINKHLDGTIGNLLAQTVNPEFYDQAF